MSPWKFARGSTLLMIMAVLLSTSVLVSAYVTFSNTVSTDREDFVVGMTLTLEDVPGGYKNYDAGGSTTHEDDADYDQGVAVSANNYSGSYHITVRFSYSDLEYFPTYYINFLVWQSGLNIAYLATSNSGVYVIANTQSVSIAKGEVQHHAFSFGISTDASKSKVEFYAISDP